MSYLSHKEKKKSRFTDILIVKKKSESEKKILKAC